MKVGIVGLPNVGKSTLFNALTKKSVLVANYPFATIDPSVGVVAVPDPRLEHLAELSHSARKIPTAVEFVDIAGLVKGAHEGEGLGNQFLSHIREVDAVAEVVRTFDDADILHVSGNVEPVDDIEVINLELIMADLQTVLKRLSSLEKEVRRGEKDALREHSVLKRARVFLEQGKPLLQLTVAVAQDAAILHRLNLLTIKPMLYVLNRKTGAPNLDELKDERWLRLVHLFENTEAKWVTVDAGIEAELSDVSLGEKQQFRRELGVLDDGVDELIRKGYELLDLITFFTTGEDETRAWTVRRGSTAPQAGAAIHSDFRDRFIRAEVIHCDKLLEAGGYPAARERGWVRTEGKAYIVQDGDVMEFKV